MSPPGSPDARRRRLDRIAAQLIGRTTELELLLAAITAGRDLILEGPPGTSKTTLLKAIASEWGVPLLFVEGNSDLTAAKLIGHHVPSRVLSEGYNPDNFVAGPLVEAMQGGGFLYIEELNRCPQETLNALLSAIGERQIAIPRVGIISAAPSFRLIASMNPFDNVGTTRISMSIHDRLCRLSIGYQSEAAEEQIVALRTKPPAAADKTDIGGRLIRDAVALARATRDHPDLRHGSSVRGAIDLTLVARELSRTRGVPLDRSTEAYRSLLFDAMSITLSGRIQVDAAAEAAPEAILRDIWERYFSTEAAAAVADEVEDTGPGPSLREEQPERPFRRRPKVLSHAPRLFVASSTSGGTLVPASDTRTGRDPDTPAWSRDPRLRADS